MLGGFGVPWSEVELNLPLRIEPRGGHYLVLPRGSGEAVAALLPSPPAATPFLLERVTQACVLGVELGTGPWGLLFWLQFCGVAMVLLCPKDIFFPGGGFAGLPGVPKMLL